MKISGRVSVIAKSFVNDTGDVIRYDRVVLQDDQGEDVAEFRPRDLDFTKLISGKIVEGDLLVAGKPSLIVRKVVA